MQIAIDVTLGLRKQRERDLSGGLGLGLNEGTVGGRAGVLFAW